MGLLHIYNTISDEHTSITANGRLKDILPEFDFSKAVIIKAGEKLTADYEVQNDDVLYIRVCPTAPAAIAVIAIVVAVAAVGVAVGVGIYANMLSAEAEEKAKQAERDAKNLAQQIQQLPFIKGAKNKSALGQTIQYVMGSTYNTPYKLNDAYYSIGGTNGKKQYINLILSCGYGRQHIDSLSIGSSVLQEWAGTDANSGVFSINKKSPYYDEENTIEIAQGAEFTSDFFRQKVKSDYLGTEIKHEYGREAEELIHQCADFAREIEVCIQFNGLRKYDNGNWTSRKVTITPYWTNDDGANWHPFTFTQGNTQSNEFNYNSNTTLRFTAKKSFTYAESYGKQISIKLVRETPMMESNSNETAYLLYVNTLCYDNAKSRAAGALIPCAPLESPFMERTTRIGIRMIANDSTKDMLDEFNVMSYAMARTWNKVLKTWTDTKTVTRNPAAWILDVLESDTHRPSMYADTDIDMESLGALYEHCDENDFFCDGIVTKEIKKSDLIAKILSLCNADMFINSDGKLQVVIDKKEDLPVALLNSQSVKSVKVAKSFERQPDGIKATFTNRDNWLMDTAYIMRDGGEKGTDDTCTESAIEYATTYDHVYKICQRRMRQQVLQPREVTVSVGREGDYYPLYSTVMLQLPQIRIGLGNGIIHRVIRNGAGEITAIETSDILDFGDTSFETYENKDGEPYTAENGEDYIAILGTATYGVIIQAQDDTGKRHISRIVYGFKKARILYFNTPIADDGGIIPQPGNEYSFGVLDAAGEFGRITNAMKITAVKPDSNGGWELTLRDYSEAIYEYGDIPEYKSNLTTPTRKELTAQAITDNTETQQREIADADMAAALDTETQRRITADNVHIELSRTSMQFHMDGEKKTLYAETLEFTGALMLDGNGLEADAVSVSTGGSGAFTAACTKSGAVITVTVTARYGAAYVSSAKVTLTATYGGNTYTATCALTASDTGVYLGAINTLNSIPASPNFGDYFTWTGADTASTLSDKNKFYQSEIYKYVGANNRTYRWETDDRIEHNADALNDVLATLNAYLADKANADIDSGTAYADRNAYSTQYMNVLAVNKIFARQIAAQSAFITKLMTQNLDLETNGRIQSKDYETATKGFRLNYDGTADFKGINIYGEATFIGRNVESNGKLKLPIGAPDKKETGHIWLQV